MAATTRARTPEERARQRTEEWEGFWWHVASFVVINVFLWGIDWVVHRGIDWAFWVTFPWMIALAFHAAAYLIEMSGISERKYEQFLESERNRDTEDRPQEPTVS